MENGKCALPRVSRHEKFCYFLESAMAQPFVPGDDLIFQLESGFGLLRVIAVEQAAGVPVWHLMAYEELFPDVESAEAALTEPDSLHVRRAHMALTDRAFERTPAARLGNRPVTPEEFAVVQNWKENAGTVSDRFECRTNFSLSFRYDNLKIVAGI